MTTLLPGALLVKEGRALAPIWLGATVAIIAGTLSGMLEGALLAFILGAAALGVVSIGHEYGNRTLTSLLAQPLSRSRLLLSKVVVLAPLLVLLSLVAAFVLFRADGIERMFGGIDRTTPESIYALAAGPPDATLVSRWQLAIVVLTPLLGLCVAPWLTMVFRNATAGLVFTLAIPSALWITGQIARAASVDFDFVDLEVGSPFGYSPALVLMIVGMLIVCLIAAVHGRLLFVGLEALDTPRVLLPSVVKRPRATTAGVTSQQTGARRRSSLLLFVQKEVRLYGLVFALAGLYAIGWSALWLARADTYLADDSFELFAAMYGLFITLMVGAISIAEERAMGTADTQFLQPWPFWKLCLVKLTTVSLIALGLGLVVPTALEAVLPLIDGSGWTVGPTWDYFLFYLPSFLSNAGVTLLLITLFSCYVSSLCVGGLRALLVAMPSAFTLASLYTGVLVGIARLESAVTTRLYGPGLPCVPGGSIERCQRPWWAGLPTVDFKTDFRPPYLYSRWMTTIAFVGFVALILFLYQRNFRSGERGATMAKRQLPGVAVYVALAAVLIGGGEALLRVWFLTH